VLNWRSQLKYKVNVGLILLSARQKSDTIYQKELIDIIVHRRIIHTMDKRICGNRDTGIVRTVAEMELHGQGTRGRTDCFTGVME